jgi:hypothetical protein
MKADPLPFCSEQVWRVDDPRGRGHYSRCYLRAVVERDGQPYCIQHDPERSWNRAKAKTAIEQIPYFLRLANISRTVRKKRSSHA